MIGGAVRPYVLILALLWSATTGTAHTHYPAEGRPRSAAPTNKLETRIEFGPLN